MLLLNFFGLNNLEYTNTYLMSNMHFQVVIVSFLRTQFHCTFFQYKVEYKALSNMKWDVLKPWKFSKCPSEHKDPITDVVQCYGQ